MAVSDRSRHVTEEEHAAWCVNGGCPGYEYHSVMRPTRTVQQQAGDWHRERFPDAQVEHVALKTAEEVGELASAIIGVVGRNSASGDGDPQAEAADVAICLMVLLERWIGGDLLDAVERKLAILNDPDSGHRSAVSR